jgi:hypothetical protein
MIERNRLFLLAVIAITIPAAAPGCNKTPVTGQNVMADDPSLSPGDKRKAMIQYHQQHDKQPDGSAAAGQPKN